MSVMSGDGLSLWVGCPSCVPIPTLLTSNLLVGGAEEEPEMLMEVAPSQEDGAGHVLEMCSQRWQRLGLVVSMCSWRWHLLGYEMKLLCAPTEELRGAMAGGGPNKYPPRPPPGPSEGPSAHLKPIHKSPEDHRGASVEAGTQIKAFRGMKTLSPADGA